MASAVARLEALAMDASQRSMPMQAALMGSQPLVPVSLSMAGVEASSPSGDAVSLAGSLDFGADDDADDGADADDAEDPAAWTYHERVGGRVLRALTISKWKKIYARPGADRFYPQRREARHALYRAVIHWIFCDPLGAGKRLRMPLCVKKRIRMMFPDPRCNPDDGCDYGSVCEANGHYVGHRSAIRSLIIHTVDCTACYH